MYSVIIAAQISHHMPTNTHAIIHMYVWPVQEVWWDTNNNGNQIELILHIKAAWLSAVILKHFSVM